MLVRKIGPKIYSIKRNSSTLTIMKLACFLKEDKKEYCSNNPVHYCFVVFSYKNCNTT